MSGSTDKSIYKEFIILLNGLKAHDTLTTHERCALTTLAETYPQIEEYATSI